MQHRTFSFSLKGLPRFTAVVVQVTESAHSYFEEESTTEDTSDGTKVTSATGVGGYLIEQKPTEWIDQKILSKSPNFSPY